MITQQQFIAACKTDDIKTIEENLLSDDVDINQADHHGQTPLYWACYKGHEAVVTLLLQQGAAAAINQANHHGQTPLYWACDEGYEAVVTLLLKYDADINQADHHGRTPLHIACYKGHEAFVALLLQQGAAAVINQTDNNGRTPLQWACSGGNEAVARLLLQQGAAIKQADNHGWTPFHDACYKGHEAVARLLLQQGAAINQADNHGWTLLHHACKGGHEGVVALLLQQDGIRINIQDENERTPLVVAIKCIRKSRRAAELLLEVLCQTRKGLSQIKAVIKKSGLKSNEVAFVKSRLRKFNQVKAANQLAFTTIPQRKFLKACEKGQLGQVKKLLTTPGIDINAPCAYHETALLKACAEGRTQVVKFLLSQKGIDSHQVDNAGQTPLHVACTEGHTNVVELLLIHDCIDVNLGDNDGDTPLHIACAEGQTNVVELLLIHDGIDVNLEDNNGDTPLNIARQGSHSAIIKLLLARVDTIIDAVDLSHFEQHQREYGQHIDLHTQNYLAQLRETIATSNQNNPNAVFDFPQDNAGNPDAELSLKGYYILRHLIRCSQANGLSQLANHLDILDNINLLLTIPSIKTFVIANVTSCDLPDNYRYADQRIERFASQTNELLRLAQSVGHDGIVMRLLDMPAIREAAENNHYYQGAGAYNLREIAQNRESSMRALSPQEQASVAQIEAAYKETMKNLGSTEVIASLKQTLEEKYLADEASRTIILNSESYQLPFEWSELQTFFKEHKVTSKQRQSILEIYYKNNNHTAYRYLSKPNRWMSDNAGYVNSNRDGRWSTFEEYQTLIAYLWVAANDVNHPPREDNITIADRVDLFLRQLALLNRAHNWDKTHFLRDKDNNSIEEEYDDGEGDKPSCLSGVKTRLFQSLLYHPLYEILDKSITRQFITDTLHEHYTKMLNDSTIGDLEALQTAVGNYFVGFETTPALENLALTDMQRATIKATFIHHYGKKKAAPFLSVVDDLLKEDGLIANHFLRFYQSAHLDKLLENMQKTCLARQMINEVALTHVRKLAHPQTTNDFQAVNQLLFVMKAEGVGCIWEEIKDVVKDEYNKAMQNGANVPTWDSIKDNIDNALLTSASQTIMQTEIKKDIKQSEGYQARRNNGPKLDKQSLFWAKPESAQWTLMGCIKTALKEYQEKSQSSLKRKNQIKALVKDWKGLSEPELVEELCTLLNSKEGSWSENSLKGLLAWHIYNHYDECGLKAKQADIFKDLPKPNKGIRHNCRWKNGRTIPLLCDALRAEFLAPERAIQVNMI